MVVNFGMLFDDLLVKKVFVEIQDKYKDKVLKTIDYDCLSECVKEYVV